ncbi:hypothetical protein IID26_02735 [Patescibacteria group bacterium]|nr:hypothetical protein [Patescibacteria group bacterium]
MSKHSNTGFGMIETIVAIGILTVAVSAAISLASRGIISSIIAREEITAFYLGIEAVEAVRNQRDENILSGASSWIDGFSPSCTNLSRGCKVELNLGEPDFSNCPAQPQGCPFLNYDEDKNIYRYGGAGPSITTTTFKRTIYLEEVEIGRELRIIVEVEWQAGPFVQPPIIIEERLFNWSG